MLARVVGVDAAVAGAFLDAPSQMELAVVEVGVRPVPLDGVGDRARAVRNDPLGAVAVRIDLVEEVHPRAPGLVGGEADPPGHHRLLGVVAADGDQDRAAALLAVPRRVEVVRAVGPQVERLGVEDQDPGAPCRSEGLVDRRAEQVQVAGGERVLAACVAHPVGILDVAVCFEPDRAAGSPERGPLRDDLEETRDLDRRVEVVGRRDRPPNRPCRTSMSLAVHTERRKGMSDGRVLTPGRDLPSIH